LVSVDLPGPWRRKNAFHHRQTIELDGRHTGSIAHSFQPTQGHLFIGIARLGGSGNQWPNVKTGSRANMRQRVPEMFTRSKVRTDDVRETKSRTAAICVSVKSSVHKHL